ncbi:MAG: PssE/Cps14G family polysaccharide biosynthesis glycosyltransferase [Lachnospiraceae bacterium]
MIFVCVGSRGYQFNRLLREMDSLVKSRKITEEVFAQIGQSDYLPKLYPYQRYLDMDTFKQYQQEAELIISHGGTGALIGALKMEKQVIAVPRLKQYGEHIDNHQLQVSNALEEAGYLICVRNIGELGDSILRIKRHPVQKKYSRPSHVIKLIDDYIQSEINEGQKK